MKNLLYYLKLSIKGIAISIMGTSPLFLGIYGLFNMHKFNSWLVVGVFILCILCIFFGVGITSYVGHAIDSQLDREDKQKVLFFNRRKKLADIFTAWAQNNKISDCPLNVVTFLDGNHLLNVDALIKYIDKHDENNN